MSFHFCLLKQHFNYCFHQSHIDFYGFLMITFAKNKCKEGGVRQSKIIVYGKKRTSKN